MKICLITAFPPSHERLNEYGYHLASELQRVPYLSVTILADKLDTPAEELPDFDVIRCWRPGQPATPLHLLRTIRELKPDVVWFNLVFSSFGTNPVAAFLGICTPALTRLLGHSTHVTLHHIIESLNLADSGVKHPRLYRAGGWLATRVLLMANSVTVLLPAYRRTLVDKYRGKNVHLRAHGVFSSSPDLPDYSRRGDPEHRVLAFGKWGTYKRLETVLEAFGQVLQRVPNCNLVIAGENHPTTPGYVEAIAERVKDRPRIEVQGYVPEDKLPQLFRSASVLVMPYSSAAGSSGVAHLACQFGLPIVSADIADFRDMAEEEGIAIDFYKAGDAASLADHLAALLQDAEKQRDMSEQNFSAAMQITMPQILRRYLCSFDWHLHSKGLRQILPFRRSRFSSLAASGSRYTTVALALRSSVEGASSIPASTTELLQSPQTVLGELPDQRKWANGRIRCSIIVPASGPADRVVNGVKSMLGYASQLGAEIVVLDTASSDGMATSDPWPGAVRLVRTPAGMSQEDRMREAVANSKGEFLLFAPHDAAMTIRESRKLVRALEDGAEVAFVSSRTARPHLSPNPVGRVALRAMSLVTAALLGTPASDPQCGFRACTRAAAEEIFRYKSVNGWSDPEVLFVARKLSFHVVQLSMQVARGEPRAELAALGGMRRLGNALQVRWHDLRGGYRTPVWPAVRETVVVTDQAA